MTAPGRTMRQEQARTSKLQRRTPPDRHWVTVEAYATEQQAKQVMRAIAPAPGTEYRVIAANGEVIARREVGR